jgi:hypothetical protein
MSFDPDKYLQETQSSSGGFDPDAYLAQSAQDAQPESEVIFKEGAGQAALEGAGNALTFGYLPHLQAMTEKPLTKLFDMVHGTDVADELPTYVERRDENIKRQRQQANDNPTATTLGTVAGSLVAAVPMAAAAPIRGASMLGRMAQASAIGGAQGALYNPGDVEGEEAVGLQMDERLDNAKRSALMGAAFQGGADVLAKGFNAAAQMPGRLKKLAEEKSFKATGAMLRDYRRANGEEGVRRIGRWMLDKGLIQPGASYDDIAKAADTLEASSGQQLGDLIEQLGLDESLTRVKAIERTQIADELERDLLGGSNLPGVNEQKSIFRELIDEFRAGGNGKIGVAEAEGLKRETGGLINWDRLPGADVPVKEQFYRSLYGKLKGAAEQQADNLGGDAFRGLKQDYGTAVDVSKIAADRTLREGANRLLSPSDYGVGGMGAIAGFASGEGFVDRLKKMGAGASLGLANKYARTHGNPIIAKSADRLSDFLARNPNLTGKFAKPLVDALAKGPGSIAAVQASQEPSFEEMPEMQIFKDPRLMQIFDQNPNLIDQLGNEKLKMALKKRLNRSPAKQPTPQEAVPEEEARQQFLNGN